MKRFLKATAFVMALAMSLSLTVAAFADVGAMLNDVNAVDFVEAEVVGNSLVMELSWADAAAGAAGSITITPVPVFSQDGLTSVVMEPGTRITFEAFGETLGTRYFAWAPLAADELAVLADTRDSWNAHLVPVEPGDMETITLIAPGAYVFQLDDSAVFWMSVAGAEAAAAGEVTEEAAEELPPIDVITGGEEGFEDWATLPIDFPQPEVEAPDFHTPVPPIADIPPGLPGGPPLAPQVQPPVVVDPPVIVEPPVFVAPVAANTGVVYNCSFLNLRRGPGVNYAAFSYLAYGDTVTILDRTRWNWLNVYTHRGEGWVFGNYINEGAAAAPVVVAPAVVEPSGAVIGTGVVYNASALNLRRGPGVNHAAFNHLPYGYTVQILERERWGWLRVSTPRGEGWVYGGYINEA